MTQSPVLWSGAAIILLALSGCTTPPAPSEPAASPSLSPSESPIASPAPTAEALPEDVLLVVTAVATADNGALLDLTMTVHRPTAFDDPASATAAALMTDSCGGGTDDSLYADQLWTFVTVDVDAIARPGAAWPTNRRVFLSPLASYVNIAADGAILDDDTVDPATPHCRTDKYLDAPGTGTMVIGLEGDTDDVSAAGQFTRWANQMWGFSGVYVAGQSAAEAGIVLSECASLVTDAGKALNGASPDWITLIDDERCQVGNPNI